MSPSRTRRQGRAGRLLALAVLAGGCGEVPPTASEPELPRVEYAGCRRAFAGPVCMPGEDLRLTLWVDAPAGKRVVIEDDEQRLETTHVEAHNGIRYQVELAPSSRCLIVRVEDRAPWRLEVRAPEGLTWWTETDSMLRSGDLEGARAMIHEVRRTGSASRPRIRSAEARLAWFSGDAARARELLAKTVTDFRRRGEHLQEALDAAMLSILARRQHDMVASRQALTTLTRDWAGPAEARHAALYFDALLAKDTGDVGTAFRKLRAALDQNERLDLRNRWLEAGQVLAPTLRRLGRGEEASALLRRLIRGAPQDLHPCQRGQFLSNAGWMSILALEAGESGEDPAQLLGQALEILTDECPLFPIERVNVTLNLALAHLHGGRLAQSRQHLREVKKSEAARQYWLKFWLLDIEGRIALEGARPEEALRLYRDLEQSAGGGWSPEVRWRSELGQAQALKALHRRPEALAALARAEQLLDAASLKVPLTEGRETFVKQREAGTRRYLDLLIESGLETEAMAVARRSRSRLLSGLVRKGRLAHLAPAEQQRWDQAVSSYRLGRARLDAEAAGDWKLSEDRLRRLEHTRGKARRRLLHELDDALTMLDQHWPETTLPAMGSDELVLIFHPLPEGWVGFAHDRTGLATERLDCTPDSAAAEELGACLLMPFADRIDTARQVRVLAYGPLRQVDFHALPYGDGVLLDASAVVYGLDLEHRPRPPAAPPQALLIADPTGNLPGARREAEAVADMLSAAAGDWQVLSLRSRQADGARVRDLLARVDLLHYAGHATFAGLGGWQSALPLAEGSRLTLGDVLALERVPRWVVLAGCETGRTPRDAAVESVSLAHAFLVAGARGVLAATRPVGDADAVRLVRAFYRRWLQGGPPAAALREAQLTLRREAPAADWASFRLIEP